MKKIIFLCAIALVFACNNGAKKASSDVVENPLTANDSTATLEENAPIMTFDENIHDFGSLIDGEVVTYKFKFKNTGKADLIIIGASASCGCTVPSYPKEPVSQGEESAIDVQFNSSGKVGTFEKNVTITSNTIPTQIYLVIRGEVKEKK